MAGYRSLDPGPVYESILIILLMTFNLFMLIYQLACYTDLTSSSTICLCIMCDLISELSVCCR